MTVRDILSTAPVQAPQPTKTAVSSSFPWPAILLGAFLVLGALFRFNNLNWDDGKLLHPDELHITDVIANRIHAPNPRLLLDPEHSPLNPRSVDPLSDQQRPRQFAYGSLPLFVTDFVAWLWGKVTTENWNEFWHVFRVGRALTVLCDLITIGLTLGLARRAYGTTAGLLAAGSYAVATMPVQLAHFFVTDTWTTTFVTATLWAALAGAQRGRRRTFALAGALAGCAMATKVTVALIAIPLLVALWLGLRESGWPNPVAIARALRLSATTGLMALLTFFLFEPYAIVRPLVYLRDIGEQMAIISGRLDVPYTRQYVGTLPLIYQAKNLVAWELGPALGCAVLAGLAAALWRCWRRHAAGDLILLSWVVPYLGLLALNEAKFLRYLLPILPVLCAFAAKFLVDLGAFQTVHRASAIAWDRLNGLRDRRLPGWRIAIASTITCLIGGVTLLTTIAFSAIYTRPHTQITASEWIYANLPRGTTISNEYWDRPLPLDYIYNYEPITFDLYSDTPACNAANRQTSSEFCRANTEATLTYLSERLEQTEYIVEATNRIYGSIGHLPWRYPVQQQYFDLLFSGRLGYSLVTDLHSFPTLGPWQFDDSFMDESFTVYDHPRVLIFKKERQLSREELRALFAPALERPVSPTRYPPDERSLLLTQLVDRLPAVTDFAWNQRLGGNGVAATLLWLLLIELLGLLAFPLISWLCGRFPDRGWGLSKLIGWLILAYPVWLLASLRLGQFTLLSLAIALFAMSALSSMAVWRWRAALCARLRDSGPAILLSEGCFLAGGAFFLALRLRDPDLWHTYWGGEKPMELAHLYAILRSANFPPYDPWFADGIINYYYYGQYLVATLVKLTGIPVEIAFNLALATVAALIATAAASVAMGIVAPIVRRQRRRVLLAAGLLGALLVVGIGNLDGAARLIGHWRDADTAMPIDFNSFVWGPSRAIDGAITEFPYFTMLYADLHAHAIALPFTLLATGLAVALASLRGERRSAQLVVTLATLALTLGALACTNLWDVVAYLPVTGVGLFFGLGGGEGRPHPGKIVVQAAIALLGAIVTGLAAYLLYRPFFSHFQAIGVGGLARTEQPTPLQAYLDHFGLFCAIVLLIASAGLFLGWRNRRRRGVIAGGIAVALIAALLGSQATSVTLWLAEHTRLFKNDLYADPPGGPGIGLTAAMLGAALALLVTNWMLAWGAPARQLPLTLLIGAVGITLGPEILFVADDLLGGAWERMNTIFKFYLQGWTLFALGSVGGLAWLWVNAPRWSLLPFRGIQSRRDRHANATILRGSLAGFLALLLVGALAYPVVATPIRVAERFPQPEHLAPTLDGYRWMTYGSIPNEHCELVSFADDYAAIRWLNSNISGTPVIAEAAIGPYRGNGSRISINTGLPTILGWDRHEYQQREVEGIVTRARDVQSLYSATDVAQKLAILQRYHVSYVVVGAVERHWYSPPAQGVSCQTARPWAAPDGLAALEGMAGRYLEPVFRSGETTIYRVLPAANSSGIDARAAPVTHAGQP